jgi:hypothetical protein
MLILDLINTLYRTGGSGGSEGSDVVYRFDDFAVSACRAPPNGLRTVDELSTKMIKYAI